MTPPRTFALCAAIGIGLALHTARADLSTSEGIAATEPALDRGLTIAVMPFTGSTAKRSGRALSKILAERLAARPLDRVVGPEDYDARPEAQPSAEAVRRFATEQRVSTVLTGQIEKAPDGDAPAKLRVEVRSGHSGAPSFEHRVALAKTSKLEEQLDELAMLVLEDLGYEPPGPGSGVESGDGGDDESFTMVGFTKDQPIAINSDELEVIEVGEQRQLLFRHNVRVVQGEITLRTDLLEAFYEKGESRPLRLVATGAVRVNQGDRDARCDRAIYLRDDQVLRCTGRAELREGCDRVRGEEIHFDLATDKVKIVGAASVLIQAEGQDGACVEDAG